MDSEQLKKFQGEQLRKIVKYAYTVPVYHEKFKKAGIQPGDIQSIEDIVKLPFITKNEIIENTPNNIKSPYSTKGKTIKSYTSGTTGKPVSVYVDLYAIIQGLIGNIRVLREHNVSWRKTRMTLIADLTENSIGRSTLTDGIIPNLKPFFSLKNMQFFHIEDDPKKMIKEIDNFKPEFIGGYPGTLRELAILKKKGFGNNIWPRCIISTGVVSDKYLKTYVEETFETTVFDAYEATESGPIAFQCRQENYHIHSDLVFLEIIDHNGDPVSSGDPGKVVITKLYGEGTPIIRYNGLDDIIMLTDEICDCGLTGGLIRKIHGRESQSIVLPGGRILLPSSLSEFYGEISHMLNTQKIKRLQIVQHRIDNIEILISVDNELRNTGPSVEEIFSTIEDRFKEKFEPNIKISIREVEEFKPYRPGIISKVDRDRIKNKIYI